MILTLPQISIVAILLAALALFVWGRWRHDVVAMMVLAAAVATGVVAPDLAFAGFSNAAVITVALVFIASRGLSASGAVGLISRYLVPTRGGQLVLIIVLCAVAAVLSAFMNNVGALAILMPVAIQAAARSDVSPAVVLMPLSFASILGGMTTLIGTPPNIIIASYRAALTPVAGGPPAAPFAMFDFSPVGAAVTLVGLLFVALIGWRLLPRERRGKRAPEDLFDTAPYLTEVRISEASKVAGQWLPDVETLLGEKDVEILSIVRGKHTVLNTGSWERITPGDVLVLRAGADDLADLVSEWSLELVGQADADQAPTEEAVNEDSQDPDATTGADNGAEAVAETDPAGDNHKESAAIAAAASIAGGASPLAPIAASGAPATDSPETDADKGTSSDDVIMTEAVVMPGAAIEHRSAAGVDLRARYGVNLIAVSRRGRAIHQRLRSLPIAAGDILLLQGADERVFDTISALGCVPLAERRLRLGGRQTALQASAIFIAGIAAAAMGFVPVAVGFGAVALAFVLLRVVPLRQLYTSIDWPVIILLGALIPVGQAVQTTGLADLVAGSVQLGLGGLSGQSGLIVAILILMAVTMTLSDLMNNAATAVIMAPVAIALAAGLQVSPDALLMAVAVGASCAFLTPIGHQNNTLILGPGGYRFGDYWRMGLPLEILVLIVATPVIVLVWGG